MARKRKKDQDEDRPVFDRGGYADRYSIDDDWDRQDIEDIVRQRKRRVDDEDWN